MAKAVIYADCLTPVQWSTDRIRLFKVNFSIGIVLTKMITKLELKVAKKLTTISF